MLAIFSGGLLGPLFLLPTISYYGLALLPVVLSRPFNQNMKLNLFTSTVAFAALLYGPVFLFDATQGEFNSKLELLEQSLPAGALIVSLEYPDQLDQKQVTCNKICQKLLANERVSSVTAIDFAKSVNVDRTYSIANSEQCGLINSESYIGGDEVELLIADKRCIISTASRPNANVRIQFQRPLFQGLVDAQNILTVSVKRDSNWTLLFENLTGKFSELYFPPRVSFDFSGGIPSSGSKFAGRQKIYSHEVIGKLSGFAGSNANEEQAGAASPPVASIELRATLKAILQAHAPHYKINAHHALLFEQYIRSLKLWRARDPLDTEFLVSLLKNNNIELDQTMMITLSNATDLIDVAAPNIIQKFSNDCDRSVYSLLYRLSPQALAPHSRQLLLLKNEANECQQVALNQLSGRLGVDPMPALIAMARSDEISVRRSAFQAMCRADRIWASSLIPVIMEYLPRQCPDTSSYTSSNVQIELQLLALKNLGADSELSNWLKTCGPDDLANFKRRLRRPDDCE